LRKYGVRFGAYHIYLPILLKPAPRALALQLWGLRHDGPASQGLDGLMQLAGSGRTSIPADHAIDVALYRTAGYRVCGERAVRVDILERLADLIRPALSWREGAPGSKPAAAFAGGGFTVVNGMTSLTGASGEDFASVLRSLGYRMERRPKPQEAQAVSQAVSQALPQAQSEVAAAAPEVLTDDGAAATDPAAASTASPTEIVDQPEAAASEVPETVAASAEPSADRVATDPGPASAEPELIEVWRPGRPEGRRRPRPRRREPGRESHREIEKAPTAQVGSGAGSGAESGVAAASGGEAASAPLTDQAPASSGQPAREGRRHRRRPDHRQDRKQHDRRPQDRFDRPQRERERPPVKRFERREKAPDPNSPFAKLAALKAQLEADAKERR
jgi:ATP-dependent RNA helicase SUPV3L1/SUV3